MERNSERRIEQNKRDDTKRRKGQERERIGHQFKEEGMEREQEINKIKERENRDEQRMNGGQSNKKKSIMGKSREVQRRIKNECDQDGKEKWKQKKKGKLGNWDREEKVT